MRKTLVAAFAVGVGIAGLVGCGSDGSTTVIKESPPTVTETTTTATTTKPTTTTATTTQATVPETTTAAKPQEPPNVVGLALPDAKNKLSAAGFNASVKNTDTAFGIVVPSNYTVCTQGKPRGNLVPILAQKYGC